MADSSDYSIPVRVGHYEMVRTIGKGNFAVVKLARHSITNSKVAVKVISTRALDSDQLRKLYREIDIMKRVGSHKHILRLYEVMQSDRHVMLVTEFCAGGEIFDQLVANGRMTEQIARNYFEQIIDAVDFLHRNGIVHRDLKAENLLLSADLKCVKLADFGFSNYYSREALLSTWCGSPPYAAPELFEGRHYCGPKADIWSLGVVLYVLVCGALPFDGHTLQSLKSRVLSGKFRIPYFMSCDCEHLIRHMLITDPDKRFSLQQIKVHKWMRSSTINSICTKDCEQTIQTIDPTIDDTIDMSIIDWVSRELSIDSLEVLESVRSRAYDHCYALYHLVNDSSHATPSSAPPSPPLLPVIPSTNQRKSSITTGIVERDTPSTPLLSAGTGPSPHRRHTFGPDTHNNATSSQTQLVAPPLLFLTPPTAPPPLASLPLAPPNYPINNMELLRPPPVLLMVNNNMGRRASDGQANYARTSADQSTQSAVTTCSASAFSFPPNSSQQTSPPINYYRRKRHSLTDTNDLVSRQRRSGLSNITSPNNERSRRRASDGSNSLTPKQQQISIASLQTELRALCVSSPPSLQTSPIHCASPTTTPITAATPSLPPSSPPPTLPQISEESHPSVPVTSSPIPLLTPPQSFRSSPVTSPNTPSIAITDELGTLQFPILPPPIDFQHVTSHPNLERGTLTDLEDISLTRLHRWRNDESRRLQFATHSRELRQTYPPQSQHNNNNNNASQQQYTSLQCLSRDGNSSTLRTTGSGSIILEDFGAATKLLRRIAGKTTEKEHVIMFDDNDIQISLEWNALRQQLVLRRVSGDATAYKDCVNELISSLEIS